MRLLLFATSILLLATPAMAGPQADVIVRTDNDGPSCGPGRIYVPQLGCVACAPVCWNPLVLTVDTGDRLDVRVKVVIHLP